MIASLQRGTMAPTNVSKERLTVFVAAGAGIPLGIPSTQKVTAEIRQLDSKEEYWRSEKPLFETLFQLLNREYMGNDGRQPVKAEANFEHMLHALEILESLDRTRNYKHPTFKAMEFILTNGVIHNDIMEKLTENPIQFAWHIGLLYSKLFDLFEEGSTNVKLSPRWSRYQEFWSRLLQNYDLDIIATNYDLCIENALLDIEQGFRPITGDAESKQRIDPRIMVPSGPSKLAHLHGSIRFGPNHEKSFGRDRWEDLLLYPDTASAREANLRGARSTYVNQSGRECRIGFSITGLQKADKILTAEPYSSYHNYLKNALLANRKLLIIGYGFADHHINSILCRMPALHDGGCRLVCIDRGHTVPLNQTTEGQELFTWPDSLSGHDAMVLLADMKDPRSSDPLCETQSPGVPWKSSGGTTCVFTDGFLNTEDQIGTVLNFLG